MEKAKIQIQDILKEGVDLSDVMKNLRKREKAFQGEISFQEQGKLIREMFPQIYENRIAEAKENKNGYALLPGSPKPHYIGNPVKWRENIYGDEEYTYQLNRMVHWRTMAEAYSFTGDIEYAKKVMEEFYSWIEECPAQDLYDEEGNILVDHFDGAKCNQGIWRSLEIGIRMYRTWPYVIHHLLDSGLIDEKFLEIYLLSAYRHGEILFKAAPILWPKADHNHYLMENNGLLYLSCMFPELKDAETWKNHALHEMERSMLAQITEEGGQIEGCASYHNGCMYWFALPLLLEKKYNFKVSDAYQERFIKMAEFSMHATRPTGENCAWGDSHTIKETACMGAICHYMVTGDAAFIQNVLNFYSQEQFIKEIAKFIWEIPDLNDFRRVLSEAETGNTVPALSTLSWQKELKQVYLRSDWSRTGSYVMFACRTPVQNQHAHIDPNGLEFTALGRTLLGDPGIYHYKNDEARMLTKSAHWHNCLTLNHENPWKYIASWEYGEQQMGSVLNAKEEEGYSYALGEHFNYRPSVHKRAVILIEGKILAVLDCLDEVQEDANVQINYNMDFQKAVVNMQEHSVCSDGEMDEVQVALFGDDSLSISLLPAKISPRNDDWYDTVRACFEKNHLPAGKHAFLTVAVPFCTGEAQPKVTEIKTEVKDFTDITGSFAINGISYTIRLIGDTVLVNRE